MSAEHDPVDPMTYEEIGAALGLSGARIQQIEAAAFKKLRLAFGLTSAPSFKRAVTCRLCGKKGHYTPTCPRRAATP